MEKIVFVQHVTRRSKIYITGGILTIMVKITIEDNSEQLYELFSKHMMSSAKESLHLFGIPGWKVDKADFESQSFKVIATIYNDGIDTVKDLLEKTKVEVK